MRGSRSAVARSLLAIVAFSSQHQFAAEEACFCEFPEDENATEPLWVCAAGYRQYRCLLKVRYGARFVSRGTGRDVLANMSFCLQDPEACEQVPSAGFSVHASGLRANVNQTVEISCPGDMDCRSATGYVAPSCSLGPNLNASASATRLIAQEALTAIPSPTHNDIAYALSFGHVIAARADVIMVGDPQYRRLWMYSSVPQYLNTSEPHEWDKAPSQLIMHPSLFSGYPEPAGYSIQAQVKLSATAIIAATWTKDALSPSASVDDTNAWNAMVQTVYIFPRNGSGQFDVDSPVSLTAVGFASQETAGFGLAVDISDNYAIVTAKHNQRSPSDGGVAYIYESSGGVWGTSPVITIDQYNSGRFGTGAAISDGDAVAQGIALVAAAPVGTVYVFERQGGAWQSTASSTLSAGTPSLMAISGSYIIITDSATSTVLVFERGAGGAASGVWGYKTTFELDASQSATGISALFGSAIAVEDRGNGLASAVVGGWSSKRAVVFVRRPSSGEWAAEPEDRMELFVDHGVVSNPSGFGRAVGVKDGIVFAGSDEKHVYVFTEQLVGKTFSTKASQFQGQPPLHHLIFDLQHLATDVLYKLCIDIDGDGAVEDFMDYGFSFSIPSESGFRLKRAEEL